MQLYRVRVLDPDRYAQTERLKDECSSFTDKIQTLNSVVKTLVDAVDAQVCSVTHMAGFHWIDVFAYL